jgi:Fe-S cluster assembly ATP-binding protein
MSLEITNLSVSVSNTPILRWVHAHFWQGTTTCIVGRNGSGKSSLALAILGYPQYTLIEGSISLDGVEIGGLSITQRAHLGLFVALQNIPEIPGIRLGEFLRTIYNERLKRTNPELKWLTPFVFKRFVTPILTRLSLSAEFLERDLNVGFSGGEKRRIEMLQIELLAPRYIIVDEIDSGLDIGALALVVASLRELQTPEHTLIIITHNFALIRELTIDQVIVMDGGSVSECGDASIIARISEQGVFDDIQTHSLADAK